MRIGPVSPRSYLSVNERERLRRQIQFEKMRLNGGVVLPSSRTNKMEGMSERVMHRMSQFMDENVREDSGLIKNKIRKLEKVLSDGTPGQLTSTQRGRLEKQAVQMREYLQKKMCPKSLYFTKSKDPEFEKAVQACTVEQSTEFTQRANDYKNVMRQLAPDDPEASNVEKLRPN